MSTENRTETHGIDVGAQFGARAAEVVELVEAVKRDERTIFVLAVDMHEFTVFKRLMTAAGAESEPRYLNEAHLLRGHTPRTAVVVRMPGCEARRRVGALEWAIEQFNARP